MSHPTAAALQALEPAIAQTLREKVREALARLEVERTHLDQILSDLDGLCDHTWDRKGKVGPYDHLVCRKCHKEEFQA